MTTYYRPIAQTDPCRPKQAHTIADGWCWFEHAERLERGRPPARIPASDIPSQTLENICTPRAPLAGLGLQTPRLMGILNTTPDSFSDGGSFDAPDAALTHARRMIDAGADIIDIGGESTRPGAQPVPLAQEIQRTEPVIKAIRANSAVPVSIDTRKAGVARAALTAGASMVNDVSALNYDPELTDIIAKSGVPICLMHARGNPETMQDSPHYGDVLLDVYDQLADSIARAQAAGITRSQIIVDPGIGFGKTPRHNLALIRGIALFHGLGCPILLGSSRKRFIGVLADEPDASRRTPGSVALALAGIAKGVQITRVHDIAQTRQALTLWSAATLQGV